MTRNLESHKHEKLFIARGGGTEGWRQKQQNCRPDVMNRERERERNKEAWKH
jgi:hypothetical protein